MRIAQGDQFPTEALMVGVVYEAQSGFTLGSGQWTGVDGFAACRDAGKGAETGIDPCCGNSAGARKTVAEHRCIKLTRIAIEIGHRPTVSRRHECGTLSGSVGEQFLDKCILGTANVDQGYAKCRLHRFWIIIS